MVDTPSRRRWLMPALMVLFVAVPLAEVWLLLRVGDLLGLWPTVGLLVLAAVAGSWLSKREGTKTWRALKDAMRSGQMPQGELADAGLVLAGGIMLVFPGFFTDVVGMFFLLPFTRPLARRLLGWLLKAQLAKIKPAAPLGTGPMGMPYGEQPQRPTSRDGRIVVDGEVIDVDPDQP
ncbi:hypothetical protein GCM10027418_11850 [Mariniluteicoccus endophyticus]